MIISSKAYLLLQSLTVVELGQLKRFLEGDSHRLPLETRRLFNHLYNAITTNASSDELNSSAVSQAVFETTVYNEQRLRYVLTYLSQATERFLIWKALEKEPMQQSQLLLSELQARGLDKAFQQHHRNAEKLLEAKPLRDTSYFRQRLQLEESLYRQATRAGERSTGQILARVVTTTDTVYLAMRLKFACELLNRKNVLSDTVTTAATDAFIASIEPELVEAEPVLAVYFHIYHTLIAGPQEAHFDSLKSILATESHLFRDQELRDVYVFAQNFCIRQINLGNTRYLTELYQTYLALLEKGLLLEGDTLAQFHFKNIVTVALRLQEFDWVEHFITQHKNYLEPDLRKNAVNYNLASLHFARKEYGHARRLLLSVEFTDVYYHLDANTLLLKTYYELADVEPLLSLVATFRTFLRRNRKISDYQRKTYLNLVKFVLKLVRVKLGSSKPMAEIMKEMEAVKQIADLTWLQTKAAELQA